MHQIENSHIAEITPLISPRDLKAKHPLPPAVGDLVLAARHEIRDILHGRDTERLMVVVGPCSIHDPEIAYEYASRLVKVARATKNRLCIVMRAYFEKPRTVVGWKGLLSDPRLDGSSDMPSGLAIARDVLRHIGALGLPCGTEFLDPVVPQYVGDLITWAAIGARTTESQTHRTMASGLSMPVGFKNSTDGSLQNPQNAMISARHGHTFLGINADGVTSVVKTTGNPDGHIVLRGGGGQSNYRPKDIQLAGEMAAKAGLVRGVIVDCSHDNSGKDHTKQAGVVREIAATFRQGQRALAGLMLESNLKPGKQAWKEGVALQHGVSITDACIGWEETEDLLGELSEQITQRAS